MLTDILSSFMFTQCNFLIKGKHYATIQQNAALFTNKFKNHHCMQMTNYSKNMSDKNYLLWNHYFWQDFFKRLLWFVINNQQAINWNNLCRADVQDITRHCHITHSNIAQICAVKDNSTWYTNAHNDIHVKCKCHHIPQRFVGRVCLQCFDAVGWVAGRASGL